MRRAITVPTGRTFTVTGTRPPDVAPGRRRRWPLADVFRQPPDAVATSVLAGSRDVGRAGRRSTATRRRRGRRRSAAPAGALVSVNAGARR